MGLPLVVSFAPLCTIFLFSYNFPIYFFQKSPTSRHGPCARALPHPDLHRPSLVDGGQIRQNTPQQSPNCLARFTAHNHYCKHLQRFLTSTPTPCKALRFSPNIKVTVCALLYNSKPNWKTPFHLTLIRIVSAHSPPPIELPSLNRYRNQVREEQASRHQAREEQPRRNQARDST